MSDLAIGLRLGAGASLGPGLPNPNLYLLTLRQLISAADSSGAFAHPRGWGTGALPRSFQRPEASTGIKAIQPEHLGEALRAPVLDQWHAAPQARGTIDPPTSSDAASRPTPLASRAQDPEAHHWPFFALGRDR